jgi:hypothetical protein
MGSNMKLAMEHEFKETICIIDRCIIETAIKIQWLCFNNQPDYFERYLADGLKKDIELKKIIETNIKERNGSIIAIEQRMLNSIKSCIESSGLTEAQVCSAKKMPDQFSIIQTLYPNDANQRYVVLQRMGSHAVHGTWADLLFHYLEKDKFGGFIPRDTKIPINQNQFLIVIVVVLETIERFINFTVQDDKVCANLQVPLDSIKDIIQKIIEQFAKEDLKSSNE